MKSYEEFLNSLGARESRGDYWAKNPYGYLGKYQFGTIALMDIDYKDISGWTGKNSVYKDEDFLSNPEIQESAIREYQEKSWEYIKHYNLDKYIGKTIKDVKITASGLLAGFHLKGIGTSFAKFNKKTTGKNYIGLRCFLESNGEVDGTDGYGTHISEYIKRFCGYKIPFVKEEE